MNGNGPLRILLVDDEPSIAMMVGKRLEAEGFEVDFAEDGVQALAAMLRRRPDLVVLDVMMPKLDGYEVCRRLKTDERFSRVPILFLTAMGQRKDRELGEASGADAYVCKPFRSEELLETVKRLTAKTGPVGTRGAGT